MKSPPIRILNLEDSPLDFDLTLRELHRASLDFSATRVESETGFRSALDAYEPDVILADYNLPGFDGVEALRIARDLAPEIPFIFVSGSIGEERAVQALREGATDYVIKDRLSRLPSAISRALAEREARGLRQKMQDELAATEKRFRYAARATMEVIWDWDLLADRLTFNEALQTVWGYDIPGHEVNGQWFVDRIHPEDRDAVLRSKAAALISEERWTGEYRFQRADGTYGQVLDRALIVRDQENKPIRLICAMLDITEERKADERVRLSELRFRSVAETASDAIVLTDAEGRIVFWNQGATNLFGYEAGEMLGCLVDTLIPERYRAAHSRGMERYRESGVATLGGRVLEFEGLRKDGREFPLEMSLTLWKSGEQSFCTALMRNVTSRFAQERRQRVQFAVARTLAESTAEVDVVPQLLRNVGTELRCVAGLYWTWDPLLGKIRSIQCWVDSSFPEGQTLLSRMSGPLAIGEGFPGGVWASARALSVNSLQSYNPREYPRAGIAHEIGIRHSVAFPIVEQGSIVAVMEFLETSLPLEDPEFLEVMNDAGHRIGEFYTRRRSEERLRQSEASLIEAQEIARLGSFSFDPGSRRVEWSDQIYRILGEEPGAFEGTYEAYLSRVHPDDRERLRALITPPLESPSLVIRHRIVTADGEIRSVLSRIRVSEGDSESPQKLFGTFQDVTDQVESEETIRRLSRQNEMILDFAAEAILGLDLSGKVIFANPATSDITGFSIDELMSADNLHSLIHHRGPDGLVNPADECPIFRCMGDGQVRSGEVTFLRKSGEPFPANFNCSPMLEQSQIIGSVVTFEDVTERQRLKSQLEQANRINGLGRVAATIAHEFNNVLMGIQPFAEVIRRRSTDEHSLKAAAQIANSVTRGKRVTQEILRFTQPSPPAFEPIPLRGWLEQILPELRSLVGPKIKFELELPPDHVNVHGDPSQLQQVLTNLVLNSRDAMSGSGVITIAARGAESGKEGQAPEFLESVALLVSDTGHGMSAEVQKNVFEPLFTTKRTGTGLGLAVAHQVLQRHGGSIRVESRPGEGTTFVIVLPTTMADSTLTPATDDTPRPTVRRVLLVEDEPAVATGISLLLELEEITVRAVDRGLEVLDAIEQFHPDAVILDITLPDIPGTEVYVLIAERHPELPVLFASGHSDEAEIARYRSRESVSFIRKPFALTELMQALEKITAHSPLPESN